MKIYDKLCDILLTSNLQVCADELAIYNGKKVVRDLLVSMIASKNIEKEKYDLLISLIKKEHLTDNHMLNTALKYKNVTAVQALISNDRYIPNSNINNYIKICPSDLFSLFLNSPKFESNADTFKTISSCFDPAKIELYLQSDKFQLPTPEVFKQTIKDISLYESSVEAIIKDNKFDLLILDKDTIAKLLESKVLSQILLERIPHVVQPMIERKHKQEEKRQHYLSNRWDIFKE